MYSTTRGPNPIRHPSARLQRAELKLLLVVVRCRHQRNEGDREENREAVDEAIFRVAD
jgi:hypothetical protein